MAKEDIQIYIEKTLKAIDARFDQTERNLTARIEAKIDDSKKDLREQIASVQKGIVRVEEELRYVQQAVLETRKELTDKIETRIDGHESKPADVAHPSA